MLTIIIPSYNEENYIAHCLDSLLAQKGLPEDHGAQVIVAANGCKDSTVQIAESHAHRFHEKGFDYLVLDIVEPGKMNALNVAEERAVHGNRAFIDADVIVSPGFIAELVQILQEDGPIYASGTIEIPRPDSWISRNYAAIWSRLPFVKDGVPGIGIYAMNAAARTRLGAFPLVYSDDRYVRLNFAPQERRKTQATYLWPLAEGLGNLLRVRRRWSEGSEDLVASYPELIGNDNERTSLWPVIPILLRRPVSGTVFVMIFGLSWIFIRLRRRSETYHWSRSRR